MLDVTVPYVVVRVLHMILATSTCSDLARVTDEDSDLAAACRRGTLLSLLGVLRAACNLSLSDASTLAAHCAQTLDLPRGLALSLPKRLWTTAGEMWSSGPRCMMALSPSAITRERVSTQSIDAAVHSIVSNTKATAWNERSMRSPRRTSRSFIRICAEPRPILM